MQLTKRLLLAHCLAYVQVIDLRSGDIVHSLRMEGVVRELSDVVALLGVRRPMAIGFRSDEIRWVVTVG